MATDTVEQKPHQGVNVMIRRKRKNMSQESLGNLIGLPQCDISKLENQEVIEEKTLSKIANALGCSLESLRDFDVDHAMNSFNSTITDTKDNSFINSGYSNEIHQTYNQTSPDLIDLYKTLLQDEKDLRIREVQTMEKEIEFLRVQLAESLKK
ncbi:helix-turn-helix protein [Dysgonomonas alginatilytica]|uniref:Helix-turn-helix protein n=1 Tax=Dysgonomonas alginatilytica TaxID=1605892 RepID=A0A2V3PSW6_9BACT|nr:helix-turn-helix transcriptional regulator [Dysgonomonas alginatilytica]PXV66889.1 helix-turn-helix protein [Dysgonomonas alginatilytica]